ncbi:hypothetical protein JZU54_08165, partial [bacterium]|nr:hypothetical protein [bacterium]
MHASSCRPGKRRVWTILPCPSMFLRVSCATM